MNVGGHVIVGLLTYHTVNHFFGYPTEPAGYILAILGSLLPDIDHPQSTFGRCIPAVSRAVARVFGHRGITHSFIAVLAFTCLIFAVGNTFTGLPAALSMGYLSHLLADYLTRSGIPLFWPIKIKFHMPLLSFRGGGPAETIVILLCATLLACHMVLG